MSLMAQNTPVKKDTIKAERNLKFSILGGPGYTPDFGFLIGGSALFTFKMNPVDTIQKRSVVPVAFAIMGSGGFNLFSRPQMFFNEDKFRIFGQFIYKDITENYYGVGYETNKDRERGSTTTENSNRGIQINPIFLFRLGQSNFFMGPLADVTLDDISNPSEGVINDPDYIDQGGTTDGLSFFNTGLGLAVSYDTRDIPANAYNGLLLDFKSTYYSKAFGGDNDYGLISLEYRQFKELKFLGERKSLGWMAQSRNSFGDVPITRMPFTGSPFDLRGYYMGQYRDKSSHVAIIEYRNMFNTSSESFWGKIYNRLGFATWAGMGMIGPSIGEIEGVLPNFGAGLRIEVQPRMNFRMDIGKNPINDQTLLYFNMTEAF
ncbi:hypothetical protein DMA11_13510 [Marinilabiliaceae bacterium JC017]|nr:hypothetical protein DMA11_13510 [Marinilabiliaceae bacterium JC017]